MYAIKILRFLIKVPIDFWIFVFKDILEFNVNGTINEIFENKRRKLGIKIFKFRTYTTTAEQGTRQSVVF